MSEPSTQFATTKLCEKCSSPLVFDHTSDKGTIVSLRVGVDIVPKIARDAKMPFLWVYFICPKCGWGLCTTSESPEVRVVKVA